MANSALIEDLERQFNENPRRVFARLANEYRKSGNLDGAIALCREHVPKHPGYISGHIVLGQALFESGAIEEARLSFEAALQLDPENLIALRHLGDIARQSGDIHEASSWYRRLLEVDPQNEEVAARLSSLDDRVEPIPEAPVEEVTLADVSGTPAAMAAEADEPVTDVQPEPIDWSDINPETGADAATATVVPQVILLDGPRDTDGSTTAGDDTAPVFGESDSAIPSGTPHDAGASAYSGSADIDPPDVESLDVQSHDPESRAEGFAAGEIEPESGPFDDPVDRSSSVGFDMPSEDILTFDDDRVEGEDLVESADARYSDDTSERRANGDAGRSSDHAYGIGDAADVSETAPPSTDELVRFPNGESDHPAFVTETAADVYERQGHLNSALEVYRQLAAQHPGNEMLRAHVARLENALAAVEPSSAVGSGKASIREVFARVMNRRAPRSAKSVSPPGGHLFPGAQVTTGDDQAASALAAAFSPEFGGDLAERGRPARAAEDELSLESVFGNPPASPKPAEDVSFDEFFPNAGSGGVPDGGNGPASGTGGDLPGDDEIFHSWLDGLKR